jgi:DNA-binding transcriptional MerR regulator
MSEKYTTEHLTALYGVSPATIRTWALEFKEFLTPEANPGQGRQRFFSAEDMAVFDLIATYKQDGKLFEDIHAALASGQRGGKPDVTPVDLSTMLDTQSNAALINQNEQLARRITQLMAEMENLKAFERENVALKKEVEMLREQMQKTDTQGSEIKTLIREIGRLEGQLEELRKQLGQG